MSIKNEVKSMVEALQKQTPCPTCGIPKNELTMGRLIVENHPSILVVERCSECETAVRVTFTMVIGDSLNKKPPEE